MPYDNAVDRLGGLYRKKSDNAYRFPKLYVNMLAKFLSELHFGMQPNGYFQISNAYSHSASFAHTPRHNRIFWEHVPSGLPN